MSQLADKKKTTANLMLQTLNEQITFLRKQNILGFKIDESQFENFINNKNIEYPNAELLESQHLREPLKTLSTTRI